MKKKNRVTNPIAHADGGVSEGLGKKLNTNTTASKTLTGTTKSLVENEDAKIRKNYKPVKIDYVKLPDLVAPDAQSFQSYYKKIQGGNIPTKFFEVKSGVFPMKILECIGLDVQEGAKGLLTVSKFSEAYKNGYIKDIVDALNANFKTPDWYLEKNLDKYYTAAKSTYLWEVICQNITAVKLDITNETILYNVRMLALAYFNAPAKMGSKIYEGIKSANENYKKRLREVTAGFEWYDIVTLGLSQAAQEIAWTFIENTFKTKISIPNEDEYARFKAETKTVKTYDKTLEKAIEDIDKKNLTYLENKKFENNETQGQSNQQNSGRGGNEDGGGGNISSTDPTIYIAIGILILIFLLKRKNRQ